MPSIAYKTASVIAFVVGVLGLLLVVAGFMNNQPQQSLMPGILTLVCLPLAYVTNRMGKK